MATTMRIPARDVRPGDRLGGVRYRTARQVRVVILDRAAGTAQLHTVDGMLSVPLDHEVEIEERRIGFGGASL